MVGLNIFFLILAVLKVRCVFVNDDLPKDDFYQEGDLMIGALLPLWRSSPGHQCRDHFVPAYIQCAHAVKYVIDDVNKADDLLPDVTLGFAIMNDCARSSVAVARATQFLPLENCAATCYAETTRPSYDVVGIVGPVTSSWNMAVANLLGPYSVPQIGWIATSNELSNKVDYEYFSRTVPPDKYQAKALVDIIHYFGWTYTGTLTVASEYGRDGIKWVKRAASERGICVAYSKEIHPEALDEEYDLTLQELLEVKNLKILILYLYWPQNRQLLKALQRASVKQFILVSTETMTPDAYSGLEDIALGMFSTHSKSKRNAGFEDYYTSISPWRNDSHPWYGQYTPETAGCTFDDDPDLPQCLNFTSILDIPNFYWTTYYPLIMDATLTFAYALDAYVKAECNITAPIRNCIKGPKLLQYIRNVSFEGYVQHIAFDAYGDLVGGYDIKYMMITEEGTIENSVVGVWDRATQTASFSKFPWYVRDGSGGVTNTTVVPYGACAQPCKTGEYTVRDDAVCCWQCRNCSSYEYITSDHHGCQRCPTLTWPDQTTFTSCKPIQPTYLKWDDTLSITLEVLTVVGLVIITTIMALFIRHRSTKIVKASGRELVAPIIFGIYLSYLTVLVFLCKPTDYTCLISYVWFHLSCTLIFGPLFLKTLRIYRIFQAGQKCEVKVQGIDQRSQIAATAVLVFCQVVILVCMSAIKPPTAELSMPFPDINYVTLQCHLLDIHLVLPLSYNLFFLFLCAVFGFLTRRVPENFSESWYIFISVTTNLFIWVAFIPTYFLAFYTYHRVALLSFALVLNAKVMAVCIFFPKVYAIYFVDENTIKATFEK